MTRCPHVEQNLAPERSPVPHLPHQRLSSATAPPPTLSTQGKRVFAGCQGAPLRTSIQHAAHASTDVVAAFDLIREVTWGRMCDVVVLTMGTGDASLMDSVLALAAKRGRIVVTNIYR